MAGNAAGVYSKGNLAVTDTIITGNTDRQGGGGLYNHDGIVTLTNSTVSGNTGNLAGGGVENYLGTMNFINNTVSGNTVSGNTVNNGSGGGVLNYMGTMTLVNSTMSGNTAHRGGGCNEGNTGGGPDSRSPLPVPLRGLYGQRLALLTERTEPEVTGSSIEAAPKNPAPEVRELARDGWRSCNNVAHTN